MSKGESKSVCGCFFKVESVCHIDTSIQVYSLQVCDTKDTKVT